MIIKNTFGLTVTGNTGGGGAVYESAVDARERAGAGAAMTCRRDYGKMRA